MASLIDDLKAEYLKLQEQLTKAANYVKYLNNQYSINHYGGQTPQQFAAIIGPQQGKVDELSGKLTLLSQKIQGQIEENQPTPEAPAAPPAGSGPAGSGSPVFIPYAANISSAAGGINPMFLYAGLAVAALLLYRFLRKR